ncbi:hypothetical protein EOPP23_10905 [Endozoicomonas sp. OPT23]|uniref:hypothetical protein n=1 Tax=Endozoicomonas sp. OPT23 TaxID=2072845 RepID=UPI00129BD362|nr:hypothetical protein [Endozoicomonas sp. OPT23]MRI33494.1 hypothetical protein [Endozoicomonas sp. OPT23]
MSVLPPVGPAGNAHVDPNLPHNKVKKGKTSGNMPPHKVRTEDDPQKNIPKGKKGKGKPGNKPLSKRKAAHIQPEPNVNQKKGKKAEPPVPAKPEETGKKEDEKDYSSMTKEQLQEEQSQALNKAKTITKRYETNSLLGRAQQFINDPNNAPKDLRVTLTLPGESTPISLIPMSKELAATPEKFAEYQKLALEVLKQYEENNFQNYDPEQDKKTLEQLKEVMRQTAKCMKDDKHEEGDKGGYKNKWEQAWNKVRHEPVALEAYPDEKNESSVPRVKVSKPDIEQQEKKKPEENPDDENIPKHTQKQTAEPETPIKPVKQKPGSNIPPTPPPTLKT